MKSQQQSLETESSQLESEENEEPPTSRSKKKNKSFLTFLATFLSRLFSIFRFSRFKEDESQTENISSREELIDEVRLAKSNDLIAADALSMIEGVMEVDHLQSRDIMLSVSQIQFIHRDNSFHEILAQVLESGHSRYPVNDENRDDIEGILHAKDLLKYIGNEEAFRIDDILRPPLYSPETQRLNELLTEFKKSRNHMAVIVDEYGGISGLVTMEDILEQIVGEIDDEHDREEIPNIHRDDNNRYTVNALTPIKEFNSYFNANEEMSQFDTIGGLVSQRFGKIPNPNERLITNKFKYTVLTSDGRRIQSLAVEPLFNINNDVSSAASSSVSNSVLKVDSEAPSADKGSNTVASNTPSETSRGASDGTISSSSSSSSSSTTSNTKSNRDSSTEKTTEDKATPTFKQKPETGNHPSKKSPAMDPATHNKQHKIITKDNQEHPPTNQSNTKKSEKAA